MRFVIRASEIRCSSLGYFTKFLQKHHETADVWACVTFIQYNLTVSV